MTAPAFKLSKLKASVYDVTYRCYSCKMNLLRRVTFAEPTDELSEAWFGPRAPRCPSCKKKMVYYWGASWAPTPPGYKP